jgi:UDP-glucuronate 4-epimerase
VRVLDRPAEVDPSYDPVQADPARSNAPYRVFNIGNHNPVTLMEFIEAIEAATGKVAEKNFMPLQDGDVPATHADVSELQDWTGFKPAMPVPKGIQNFVAWYRDYFKV